MAGRGPLPKPQHQRERNTIRALAGAVRLTNDGSLRGPDFPHDVVPTPHPATLAWWEVWRRSPQASVFLPTDWQTLKRAARLQDDVVVAPRPSAAAVTELRLIEERLGATLGDRLRLRLVVDSGSPVASVTPIRGDAQEALKARLRGDGPSVNHEPPVPF